VRLGDGYETARIDDLVGISNVIEFGATILRAGYIRSSVSVPSAQPFFDAFRAFGERGAVLADRYEMRDKKTSVLSMGGSYDPGQWFVTAEWARTSTHSVLANKEGWYAGGGYRTGNLTPFITYAQVRTLSPKAEPGIPTSGLTSSAAVVATRLNTTLNYYLSSSPDQKTVAIGARWDFSKDVAVTVQYDRIALGPGSQGMLVNRQPDFTPGGTVHVASAVVHFLF
jgi:predicted porin